MTIIYTRLLESLIQAPQRKENKTRESEPGALVNSRMGVFLKKIKKSYIDGPSHWKFVGRSPFSGKCLGGSPVRMHWETVPVKLPCLARRVPGLLICPQDFSRKHRGQQKMKKSTNMPRVYFIFKNKYRYLDFMVVSPLSWKLKCRCRENRNILKYHT